MQPTSHWFARLCHSRLVQHLPAAAPQADAGLALLQHGTRLYLADAAALSADMFYQQALRRFGAFERVTLQPPAPLAALLAMALEVEEAAGRWKVRRLRLPPCSARRLCFMRFRPVLAWISHDELAFHHLLL